ncbi:MAG: hypothetical protein JKY56_03840, partial [Kofleriaceae bacterium]|nr:hypothetical protein [Kofleriaceae bacterium]
SFVSLCRAGSDDASEQDWQAAADYVRANKAPGELIVFAPEWSDPIGRQYLGDQIPIEMAARMDAARYSGIWEVSTAGSRAKETKGLSADRSESFGELRLRHYPQEAARISYDFTKEWRTAKVTGHGRPRFGLQEVGFEPHQCVLVVPRPNQSITLTFETVILGSEIVGYVGLADVFTRRKIRDPGQLEVLIDGKVVSSATAGVEDGWVRFSAKTNPGQSAVEFRLTAVGPNAKDRRICFAAEARE